MHSEEESASPPADFDDETDAPCLAHCKQDVAIGAILVVERLDDIHKALRGVLRVVV